MTEAARNELRRSYTSGFHAYLRDPNEHTLRAAYELGREAVTGGLGVLDLALVHHEALASALRAAEPGDAERIARSAADFLLDSLSAFEMVRQAYEEARDAAVLERRQASMLRQLSSLLADASLALDASGSLEEMLRLVVEQARELTRAACCVAAIVGGSGAQEIEAAAYEDGDDRAASFVRADLSALARLAGSARGAARMSRDELARHPAWRDGDPGGGWLAAVLTALDGRELGWIQLLGDRDAEFTEVDEAVLAHLAQMTSASVERVRLYDPSRRR
jgi:Phosphoserine phosphatase RsbU, N-terminal domain/GAF domain